MKKNLLITGGSGYLGVNLALSLKKKYNVFLGSRNQNNTIFHDIKIGDFRWQHFPRQSTRC